MRLPTRLLPLGWKESMTARSYVKNGLFRQVDAIENLGYGQHTDTPTAWHDLVQGDDWNIYGATYANGVYIKNDITTLPIQVALTQSQVDALRLSGATLEVVISPTENTSASGCIAAVGYIGSLSIFRNISSWGIGGNKIDYQVPYSDFPSTASTISLATNNTGTSVFLNGVLVGSSQDYTASDIALSFATWNATIGISGSGRCQAQNPIYSDPITGLGYHEFRLYSRALSAAEIAANYAIDKARFNMPTT